MHLQESGEMYLEAIFVLSKTSSFVRAVDVGEYLGYSKPSVSRAMGLLKKAEYLTVDRNGAITLTESGREIGSKIYERHTVLTALLKKMGVPDDIAATDACKMEHTVSDESFRCIKNFARDYLKD